PGHVAADIAGIEQRFAERRVEQLDQTILAAHQLFIERLHRLARTLRLAGAGKHSPALRNRVDPAFDVAGRAEWRAVVEVGAAVPGAVPAVFLEAQME